jgi:hypothetical protein
LVSYDYLADDESKVVPLETGDDEYEPEEDDIPLEEREPRDKGDTVYEVKSGEEHLLKAPIILNFPVVDDSNNPLPGHLYRIYLPSGRVLFGETDDNGILNERIEESGDLIIEMEDGSTVTVETE